MHGNDVAYVFLLQLKIYNRFNLSCISSDFLLLLLQNKTRKYYIVNDVSNRRKNIYYII